MHALWWREGQSFTSALSASIVSPVATTLRLKVTMVWCIFSYKIAVWLGDIPLFVSFLARGFRRELRRRMYLQGDFMRM